MDDEHEVLDINSGIANFNTDEYSTRRTAFREALKLRAENSEISKNRLEMWLTVGTKFNEYSTDGTQHAVEYYEEVNGDFDKLKLSYDLHPSAYYETKYKL
jgi:flagellar basal body rod protein FlgB